MTQPSRIDMQIKGVITNTSEFFEASFSQDEWRKPKDHPNATLLMEKPIALFRKAGGDEDDGEEMGVRTVNVPFITGNSIRGRLRRCAADLVEESLISRGETLNKPAYYLLRVGSSSTASAKGNYDLERHRFVVNDPFLGLFGAETDFSSRLVTNDLLPILEETLMARMVPDEYRSHINPCAPWQLKAVVEFSRKDDFIAGRDDLAPFVVDDYDRTYSDSMKQLVSGKAARKEDPKAKKTDFDNIMACQVIVPGTKFLYRNAGRKVTDVQAGMLLLALERMARERPLGGCTRFGYGEWTGKLDLVIDDEVHRDQIIVSDNRLVRFGAVAEKLAAAARAAIESYDPVALTAFATGCEQQATAERLNREKDKAAGKKSKSKAKATT